MEVWHLRRDAGGYIVTNPDPPLDAGRSDAQ
jgi:hypothetical protein